jgi:hypothetical protein
MADAGISQVRPGYHQSFCYGAFQYTFPRGNGHFRIGVESERHIGSWNLNGGAMNNITSNQESFFF